MIKIISDFGGGATSSTKCAGHLSDDTRQNQDKPQNINRFCGFFLLQSSCSELKVRA